MATRLRPHLLACTTGAALDNLFRQVAIVALVAAAHAQHPGDASAADAAASTYASWALILFSVPFVLLAPAAGVLGDRIAKHRLIRAVRLVDVPICVFGVWGFSQGQPLLLLGALCCLAVASAVFAPVKWAVVPELVAPDQVAIGNGQVAAVTVVAILGGTCLAALTDPQGLTRFADAIAHRLAALAATPRSGLQAVVHHLAGAAATGASTAADALRHLLVAHPQAPVAVLGVLCGALCLIGIAAAYRIPALPPASTGTAGPGAAWSPWEVVRQMRALFRIQGVAAPALALGGFWGVAAVAAVAIPPMAAAVFAFQQAGVALFMLCLVIGVVAGSLAAGRWNVPAFPAGLPLLGAGLASGAMAWAGVAACHAAALPTAQRSPVGVAVALLVTGIGAGLWEVPLTAELQHRSPPALRNSVMAGATAFGSVCTAIGAAIYGLITVPPAGTHLHGISPGGAMAAIGLASLGGATVVAVRYRRQTGAFLLVALVRHVYRLRILGAEHLPTHGGCVVACNHVSFADGLVVTAGLPRPGRFLVYRHYTQLPILGWLLRASGVIPIAAEDGHRALVAAITAAVERARAGEVVVIFPEGKITRSGLIDTFRSGVERISAQAGVPVVPAHLHGLYGGVFSRAARRGWPRLWKRLTLRLGAPLAAGTSAGEVRARVMGLSVDQAFARAAADRRTLGTATLAEARWHPRATAIRDAGGGLPRWRLCAVAQAVRPLLGLAADEATVGVVLPPGRGGTIVNLALAFAGRTSVNLNHTAGPAQLVRMCELAQVRTIISSRQYLAKIGEPALPGRVILVEDLLPRLSKLRVLGAAVLNQLLPARWRARGRPDDVAVIIFSSGSTGDPKGVELTHRQILANCHSVMEGLELHLGEDAILSPLPLFHSFGLVPGMWLGLVEGLTVAAHPNPMDGRALGELAQQTRATFLIATPTFVRGYLRTIEAAQLATLRFAVVGAERCPAELRAAFKTRFGADLLEGYGCTELAPVVSTNLPDHVRQGVREVRTRDGSVGRALPGQEVRAIDPGTLQPLPVGAEGLLVVRSPARMRGYLGRPDLTERACIGDGYVTGDLGRVEADGFIFITGRLARFAKIGGEMVPLDTVEGALQTLLGEAIEVAVAAVPDSARGERLVVMHTGFTGSWEEVIGKLEALPPLWRPKPRDCVQVPAVPKLGTGKRDLAGVKRLAQRLQDGAGPTPATPSPTP